MINLFIGALVKFLLYVGFVFGVWLLFSPFIIPGIKSSIKISRFRRVSKKEEPENKKKSALLEHLDMLLRVVFNRKIKNGSYSFLVISFSIFSFTLAFLYGRTDSKITVLLFALLISSLPYVILQVLLRNIRVGGSYEGIKQVAELTNQYKIHNMNMIEAIDKAANVLKNCPYSRKALFRLSLSIKEYRKDEELDEAIKEFVYSFDTEWAILLGMNISIAISDGSDIRASLDDILDELKQISSILEKDKRYNHEAFSLIRLIVPGVYIFSVFFAIKFLGFTFQKFLEYQFLNSIGLKFALITFASMIINFIVYFIIRKPKYDI